LLQASYSINATNQLQAGEPTKYNRNSLVSTFTTESAPVSWLSLLYAFNFSHSKSNLSGDNVDIDYGSINRFDHKFKLNFFPAKGWQTGLNMEYENTTGQSSLPDVFFMDANIVYKYKKFEFTLKFNNILNQNDYVVASYGDFYYTKNTYELRQRNMILTVRLSL
jgi:hypothetical protein